MPNPKVGLFKRVNVGGGKWLCCPVVQYSNGRIRADRVIVNGREEVHPEGAFVISWRENGKLLRRSVGKDATEAVNRKLRQESILRARANGVIVEDPGSGTANGGASLADAVRNYLDDIKLTKKPKTHAAYKTALDYFLESCKKRHVHEVERRDLLQYSAFLRDEKEQSPRSVWNKFSNIMTFLKSNGVRGILSKGDWPKYVEEEPEIYEREELDKFFAACNEEERLWFEFFVMTGMREQEVMHATWADINLNRGVVVVRYKPEYCFSPTNYKEREIPIPSKLVEALKRHKKKSDSGCPLLFPTSGCKPKLDFLDCCKAIASRSKLNKKDFWLHKFRATFATRHLWEGVDLRTVQSWMGHADLESTMRYLKPNRSQAVRDKVEETWA